ncbi:xylanase [Flavobacterium zepuense]|uniref:Xylanase n=1 Tax=Flavobacterium zepuense TaxID=2593302 RepID=A0A552V627_9FLAO|nr:glycoside hydrolase [Flavobacterium zepuense]TRW25911.1 xylanase [Flavobacterium zepuense]
MIYKTIYSQYAAMLFAVLSGSCSSSDTPKESAPTVDATTVTLNIDDATAYQTIEHFGASDAWSCQFVGNWPDAKKNGIADLLFSQQNDAEGNPQGIGLSIWRFNVGAGSAEQGAASGIGDEWRRAESFLQPNGTYDWNRQQGQVWFANAAKQRGVSKLLIFPNSPPVSITRNGKAYANVGLESNLAADKFNAYTDYLTSVTEGLQTMGLTVDYISPMNEPQWDWSDGGQEGTPFYNNEISQITTLLNQKLENKGLASKINIAEAGQINYLYEVGNKPGRSDQVKDFFVTGSPNYVGNLSHLENAISGHSYFTTSAFDAAVAQRQQLNTAVSQVNGLKYWMSEYCILGDNSGEINGNGRDLGIEPALYLARTIFTDLSVAQATAWHWWIAISPYDYKDGLIYIDKQKENGNYYDSKMLWALGNYSRFIRPGFKRVKVESSQGNAITKNFLFSSYKDPLTGKLVTVIVNSGNEAVNINLQKQGAALTGLKAYVTSSDKNLKVQNLNNNEAFAVPARSIVTLTN